MSIKHKPKANRLQRWSNFQLPHAFKRIGLALTALSVIVLIAHKLFEGPEAWVEPIFTDAMLVGMLLMSLAREKIEDEYIISLRAQSYRLAFIVGVSYGLVVLPLVNLLFDVFLRAGEISFDVNYFDVLFYMLLVQLLFYSKLKRHSC